MNQGSNEKRQITLLEQGVTPPTGIDVVIMIHNLRNKIHDIRDSGVGGYRAYSVIEEISSSFTAQILAQSCMGNFPNLALYDGNADPSYHILHYETWMEMQGVTLRAMCQAFFLTLTRPGFELFRSLRKPKILILSRLVTNFE